MNRLQVPFNPYSDMVISHLREQIRTLHNVLDIIERDRNYEGEYIHASIKVVEYELRRLRKMIEV